MGVEPKIGVGFLPPKIIHLFNRVFHEINHPFWGKTHYFWKHPYRHPKCNSGMTSVSIVPPGSIILGYHILVGYLKVLETTTIFGYVAFYEG